MKNQAHLKSCHCLTACLVVIALMRSSEIMAAIVSLEGTKTTTGGFQMATSGTYGGGTLNPTVTATISVDIDDVSIKLTYNTIKIEVMGFITSNVVSITSGLGQVTNVTTDITYDPITIIAHSTEPLTLTPTTGGNYTIASPVVAFFPTLALSGHYSVTGPTQTDTGNFLTPVVAATSGANGFRWSTLNSIGYPDSSQLTGPQPANVVQRTRWNTSATIIDTTVDGVHITAALGTDTLIPASFGTITLAAPAPPAPEPTTAALLLGGSALLALRRRRSPAGA